MKYKSSYFLLEQNNRKNNISKNNVSVDSLGFASNILMAISSRSSFNIDKSFYFMTDNLFSASFKSITSAYEKTTKKL